MREGKSLSGKRRKALVRKRKRNTQKGVSAFGKLSWISNVISLELTMLSHAREAYGKKGDLETRDVRADGPRKGVLRAATEQG